MTWILFAALVQPQSVCVTCHPAERVQLEASVHSREGIGCESCHGGVPESLDEGRAHSGDYRGVPSREDIPALCASCHADPTAMRPYNLPIDQFALYQISGHGRKLAEGDDRVAVCTDCHGAHEVRSASNPESPIFRVNVPETCGHCHADAELMADYRLSADVLDEYRGSVHGEALLEDANPNAPNCARCHGVHGASPPGFGDVAKVCGQCHGSAREYFERSVHKEAMDAAGLPECASCHGNHAIGPAGTELAEGVCLECHESGSPPAETGRRLLALQSATVHEIERAGELIEEAERIPLDVGDYRARLELARTHLQEAYPVMHSLDVEQVTPLTLSARSGAEDVQREIYEKLSDIRLRRLGLVLFWFYILLTVAILVRLRRQKKET